MPNRYDVIIIGSGAGGGTLAYHLAPSGKRILLLERGGWLPQEKQNWSSEDVFVDNRYVSKEPWIDKNGKSFQPGIHYYVGGATKMYGTALYRLRKEVGAVAHQADTCRFGDDPKTSVLDRNCKAHGLDNLYIVDTSFYPSIGAVNPALTAMANALRVGDHLLKRLG
jgi:choline dehydrogenase-like flavoprotein